MGSGSEGQAATTRASSGSVSAICTTQNATLAGDRERQTPTIIHYPLNYVFNQGTWFIYSPKTGVVGDGAFMPKPCVQAGRLH
jgi:hypothetical protein